MYTPLKSICKFEGRVVAVWDTKTSRHMVLLEPFSYQDSNGGVWIAPIGSVIDGASIPRILWTAISSPFCGKYRRASVIHDVFCKNKVLPHDLVHKMFLEAMLTDGVKPIKAKLMYLAVVTFGPKW